MTGITREALFERIRSSIDKHGFHVYLIAGKQVPRFAYTIGVSEKRGTEFILAGATSYANEEARRIVEAYAFLEGTAPATGQTMVVEPLGTFSLRAVAGSWIPLLLRGALDYYAGAELSAFQIVPDDDHWTLDTPDLSQPWSVGAEPAWRWLTEPWVYAVSDRSIAVTNLAALRGKPITEAVRWEVDQWELFSGAGPDVPREEIREVPLGTLLASDASLVDVLELEIGKGLWRDPTERTWQQWGK